MKGMYIGIANKYEGKISIGQFYRITDSEHIDCWSIKANNGHTYTIREDQIQGSLRKLFDE